MLFNTCDNDRHLLHINRAIIHDLTADGRSLSFFNS
ncbi:RAxF-45 family protein [Thalassobacillus hwangdonensis]|uniref:RAxF-45 family protein n=1 Tax=Thalassobacillus hwangdonensis TaxID=546108 RepID=A0ABW3L0J4_9BACI